MILGSHLRRCRKDSQTPSIPGCKTKAQRTSCFLPDPWAQEDSGGSRKPAWHLTAETTRMVGMLLFPAGQRLFRKKGEEAALSPPLSPPFLCSSLPPRPFTEPLSLCCRPARGPSVLLLRSWVVALLRTAESSLSGWFSLGFVPTAERGEVRLCDRYTGSSEMLGPALPAR